jgi:site-specific DNA-cytosine methylase
MVVLSLFDGCSGGQQALERLNIKVNKYYASEIDKFAIEVTMANYPNTIQLGSVVDVDVSKLDKIDLLCGGSPCQSFSFAGKRNGMSTKDNIEILTLDHYLELKEQKFEFEGQSYLFWEYMRVLEDIRKYNPNVKFLLENVIMGEKWQKVLTQAIGINPIEINSALVSAQNRKRLYWTNIGAKPDGFFGDLKCAITQPQDKGILLKDILESEVDAKYYLSEKVLENNDIVYGNKRLNKNIEKHKDVLENGDLLDSYCQSIHKEKSITITTRVSASSCTHIFCNIVNEEKSVLGGDFRHDEGFRWRENGKSGTISTKGASDNSLSGIPLAKIFLNKNQLNKFNENVNVDKHNTLTLAQGRAGSSDEYMDSVSKIAKIQGKIRRLTPLECERLQTIKDNYTNHVSNAQRYKMIGNGWTIDVIAHIFSFM